MSPRLLSCAFILFFELLAAALPAQQAKRGPDSPQAALEKAESEYAEEMKKAKAGLEKAFVKAEKAAAKSADPKALLRVKDQRRSFAETGELPTVVSTREYEQQASRARSKLSKALGEVARRYARKNDAGKLEAIERRLRDLNDLDTPTTTPGGVAILIGTAEGEAPKVWRCTERNPGFRWMADDFNDRTWEERPAAFGSPDMRFVNVNTVWNSGQIWMRANFIAPRPRPGDKITMRVAFDDNPEIYINGQLCMRLHHWNQGYSDYLLTRDQAALIKPGKNSIAVTCRNTAGGQMIDVGLSVEGAPR